MHGWSFAVLSVTFFSFESKPRFGVLSETLLVVNTCVRTQHGDRNDCGTDETNRMLFLHWIHTAPKIQKQRL